MSEVRIRQIGRLGANPELTPVGSNGVMKATIVVLSNKRFKNRDTGEVRESATRIRWTLWREQAENATKYLRKGSLVAIEGVIDNNDYKKDGEEIYDLNFTVQEIEYLESKAVAEARQAARAGNGNSTDQGGHYDGQYREDYLPPT